MSRVFSNSHESVAGSFTVYPEVGDLECIPMVKPNVVIVNSLILLRHYLEELSTGHYRSNTHFWEFTGVCRILESR
jgi:hypothetical protein